MSLYDMEREMADAATAVSEALATLWGEFDLAATSAKIGSLGPGNGYEINLTLRLKRRREDPYQPPEIRL